MGCGSGSNRFCRGSSAGSGIRVASRSMTGASCRGFLFVLHTGIGWEHLPQELGFGCGMTAWRRLRAWQQAGVWERLHELLLAELHAADQLEWERAVADSSHLQAKKGARKRVPAPSIAAEQAASTTCS
jgi:transposase